MSKLTKMAAKELRGIPDERIRLESLRAELEAINTALYSPRGATLSSVPMHGGGNRHEEKIVNIIDDPMRDALMQRIEIAQKRLALIDAALGRLSPLERRLLEAAYIGEHVPIARLMEETNYSDAQINRIKYAALSKYANMRGLDACL